MTTNTESPDVITATLLLAPKVMAASVMGFADMIYVANRVALSQGQPEPFKLRMLSLDGQPVICSTGYPLAVDGDLASAESNGVLIVPGLMLADGRHLDRALSHYRPQIDWLKHNHQRFDRVVTNCSATFLLAEAGLLDGKSATTSWWLTKAFARRYPQVDLDADAICRCSDHFILGGGSGCFTDLMLVIIERYGGQPLARTVAKYMLVDNQRRSQAPYAILPDTNHDDVVVARAQAWIHRHLQQDFKVEDVARHVAVSSRTLIRRFQNTLAESPQTYTQRARIEHSKLLLETTQLRFSEIVERCGYSDESAFRRLFKKLCKVSPSEYRRKFHIAHQVPAVAE
ncbi:GlxA family transcriptional regulator [Exilibacterium tricleocarpae]|nr:helix-turn-helix domain-containing protein [Exilibacterium tricleocarpae]